MVDLEAATLVKDNKLSNQDLLPNSSDSERCSLLWSLNLIIGITLGEGLSSFLIWAIGMGFGQTIIIWTGIGLYLASIILSWGLLVWWFQLMPKDSEIGWDDLRQPPIKLLGLVLLGGPLVYLGVGLYLSRYDLMGVGIGIYGADGLFVLLMRLVEYLRQTPREEIGLHLIRLVMGLILWLGVSIPFILIGLGTIWGPPLFWKLGVGMYVLGLSLWVILTLMSRWRDRCGSPP